MQSGYTRTPKLLKGALIHFSAPMLVPIPNIIVFQYNPETMTRQVVPWSPESRSNQAGEEALPGQQINELSQPYDPDESFTLALDLDATDALEQPAAHPIAVAAGVADRISALELLCYPPGPSAIGGLLNISVTSSIGTAVSGTPSDAVPRLEVPIVLFFWGPGRVVPVRVTTFSVEEQQFSPLLYPIHAKVSIGLKVLDENHLLNVRGEAGKSAVIDIAKACYKFTRAQKEALAMANLANSVKSVMGMLPI
jgi:hypothetical protein